MSQRRSLVLVTAPKPATAFEKAQAQAIHASRMATAISLIAEAEDGLANAKSSLKLAIVNEGINREKLLTEAQARLADAVQKVTMICDELRNS